MTTGIVGVILLAAISFVLGRRALGAAKEGHRLPLAILIYIVIVGFLQDPFNLWAVGPYIWILSIVVFLDPVSDDDRTAFGRLALHTENTRQTPSKAPVA